MNLTLITFERFLMNLKTKMIESETMFNENVELIPYETKILGNNFFYEAVEILSYFLTDSKPLDIFISNDMKFPINIEINNIVEEISSFEELYNVCY